MKKKCKIKKLLTIFTTTVAVTLISTSSFAIYKAMTIGDNKLSFKLKMVLKEDEGVPVYKANSPKLVDGMVPVIWNDDVKLWQVVDSSDLNWYNYEDKNANGIIDDSEKKWANVMMPDSTTSLNVGDLIDDSNIGSMFVWIPRYEYKINYYTDSSKTEISAMQTAYGSIDINFLEGNSVKSTTGYTINSAFRNGSGSGYSNGEWDKEIEGIWIAKFEATTLNAKEQSKPNAKNAQTITPSEMYDRAKASTFGLADESVKNINAHMIKNSEWGAVSYLAYSKYGVDGENIVGNNYFAGQNTTITGYYINPSITEKNNTTADLSSLFYYSTENGQKGSTTGTIYGVYDMKGGRTEYSAAYLKGTSETSNLIKEGNTKYCTIYEAGSGATKELKIKNASKIGDAIGETYFWNFQAVGKTNTGADLKTPTPTWLSTSAQYILRGGSQSNCGDGGIVSFYILNNNASVYRTYREILIVE